ncbi:hypothetical protein QWY82_05770 [Simiduia curdlanivorans]|uniref:Uncharacterized protein n=1 Tax=Simiduia curdlanivorans TaxID=1492769 RepID=A0ABV8V3Q6_9GAMM|nr:hypothetical protein [Simiduia curdlanivorans]MDN3638319.1 hypothetical protein [Simiduia curdlanivorans]
MTEEATQQPQAASGEKPNITLNIPEVVNLACNVLHGGFIAKGDEHGKKLFKQLKEQDSMPAGTMTVAEKLSIQLSVALDRKEFRGQFGFPVFKATLQAMLQNIGKTINARQDLNFLTSETGNILIHKPGVIEKDGEFNVLVLVLMPKPKNEMQLCLTYLDPDQYETLRNAKESKDPSSK